MSKTKTTKPTKKIEEAKSKLKEKLKKVDENTPDDEILKLADEVEEILDEQRNSIEPEVIYTTITSFKTNQESQDDIQAAKNLVDYIVKNNKMVKEVNYEGDNRITKYTIAILKVNEEN